MSHNTYLCRMDVRIDATWKEALADQWTQPYFTQLAQWVRAEYGRCQVFPPAGRIFAAFDATPFNAVKVVIIGQDPYHGDGMANGLSFSVNPGIAVPRSLSNIFTEIASDTGVRPSWDGDLTRWARQGVLLLNATLTVRAHEPMSHRDKGWEQLTDAAIRALNQGREHLVFMLWGASAGRKAQLIDANRHLVLTAPHPSPLSASRGFFGCRHFTRANEYLAQHGLTPIDWR